MARHYSFKQLHNIDVEKCSTTDDVLSAMREGSFGGRELGRAWSVLQEVMSRPSCDLILTISGALSVAQLGTIFGSLIEKGIVKCVITTGALVTHCFVEEVGLHHYVAPERIPDDILLKRKLNRIYDSLEPESNLETLEQQTRKALSSFPPNGGMGSYELIRNLSAALFDSREPKGLLGAALRKKVDVFVPALIDSELGLYVFHYLSDKHKENTLYDPIRDLKRYAEWMSGRNEVAFLTLGGGVPRNWGQQMIPYLRSVQGTDRGKKKPSVFAGVRICPDTVQLGHLSGSTYSEGVSWGKFNTATKDRLVEVFADATVVFPFLAKAMLEFRR